MTIVSVFAFVVFVFEFKDFALFLEEFEISIYGCETYFWKKRKHHLKNLFCSWVCVNFSQLFEDYFALFCLACLLHVGCFDLLLLIENHLQ